MSDDDYDYEDRDNGPDAIAGVTAEIRINVPPLDLETEVGGRKLVDIVVGSAIAELSRTAEWPGLKRKVHEVRDAEIRADVRAQIVTALGEGFYRTNSYGDPQGEPTTLRAVIAEMAEKALNERGDTYGNRKTLREILADEVNKAIKAELIEVIEAEKQRIVTQMREKAAGLIAEAAVAAGLAAKEQS